VDIEALMREGVDRSGTRVEQRLELLEVVLSDTGADGLQARLEQAQIRLTEAMAQLRREAKGQ